MKRVGLMAGLVLAALAGPASAHHSWTAEYDAKKPVKVSGVVFTTSWACRAGTRAER